MNAMQQLLTKHIDIWTGAETEKKARRGRAAGNAGSVYGIQKLRELILELAVRGKLVPQDTDDGSVATFCKQSPLVERQNKKSSHDADPETEKESFSLPSGWMWVRLPQLRYVTIKLAKLRLPKVASIGLKMMASTGSVLPTLIIEVSFQKHLGGSRTRRHWRFLKVPLLQLEQY